eukprot:3655514-Prymnesium_polylepis.1
MSLTGALAHSHASSLTRSLTRALAHSRALQAQLPPTYIHFFLRRAGGGVSRNCMAILRCHHRRGRGFRIHARGCMQALAGSWREGLSVPSRFHGDWHPTTHRVSKETGELDEQGGVTRKMSLPPLGACSSRVYIPGADADIGALSQSLLPTLSQQQYPADFLLGMQEARDYKKISSLRCGLGDATLHARRF